MDKELAKYASKTPLGGLVWTGRDLQRFFERKKVRRRK